jgi:hypothetical protein
MLGHASGRPRLRLPLDKGPLHTRLLFIVRIAIGTHEPLRKVRLGPMTVRQTVGCAGMQNLDP